MPYVVVVSWFILDDSPDIPRLDTRSSRMVRPPFRAFQALWHVKPRAGYCGKLCRSNEFELFTARSDCLLGGSCRVVGVSVRIPGTRNRIGEPTPINFRN